MLNIRYFLDVCTLWDKLHLTCLFFFFTFIRFSGVPPSNLGNNTKLVDWMPQNDLLGERIKGHTT